MMALLSRECAASATSYKMFEDKQSRIAVPRGSITRVGKNMPPTLRMIFNSKLKSKLQLIERKRKI